MLKDDYETARAVAEKNLDMIKKQMPLDLARREEALFERISVPNESPLDKLEKLYMFMDYIYVFVGKFTPCQKGCDHCCYIKVSISSLEAEYIEKTSGIRQTKNLSKEDYFGIPCPFLDNHICSIYKCRPFVCRRHVALFDDPRWCQLDLCKKYNFPRIEFSEVERSYRFILHCAADVSLCDIRQLFSEVTN